MGGGKKVTIGYWYGFGIHMGIGRAIDGLTHIKVDNKDAYKGNLTASGRVRINKPNLFGGEKREGGIDGYFTLMMGEPDQVAPRELAGMLGKIGRSGGSIVGGLFGGMIPKNILDLITGSPSATALIPGFRGMTTAFYDGWVTAMNPYPKPWRFRVYRLLKGWKEFTWYPSKIQINLYSDAIPDLEGGAPNPDGLIRAMNPAHILYECLTNPVWGRGFPRTTLVDAPWMEAADTLYEEGFGLAFAWKRQDSIAAFVQTVLDHIGGLLVLNRATGTIELRLIRNDYDADDIPHFDFDTGLLKIEELDSTALDSATNSVAVSFFDPALDEERITAPTQNISAIQMAGSTNATVQSYFAVPVEPLASRLALRDLTLNMGTLRRGKFLLDQTASRIQPGSVFSISSVAMGIEKLILRAGQVDISELEKGVVSIAALEDIFGLPSSSFVEPANPEWIKPDRVARNVTEYLGTELSYAALARMINPADLSLVSETDAFISVYGASPGGMALGYELRVSPNLNSLGNYTEAFSGEWPPIGLLPEDIPLGASNVTFTFEAASNLEEVQVGDPARIDNEEFRVVAINYDTWQITLARGCIDTVPAPHSAESIVWFYRDAEAWDDRPYLEGDTIYYRMLTFTTSDVLPLDQATSRAVQLIARQGLPYPPGNVRVIGNMRYPEAVAGAWNLSPQWSHRDRITQSDRLIDTLQGNFGPEAGVTYELTIQGEKGATLVEAAGLTGVSYPYTYVNEVADSGLEVLPPSGVFEVLGQETYKQSTISLNPLAYYALDEVEGPVLDSSGNEYHTTLEGSADRGVPGLVAGSKAFRFNRAGHIGLNMLAPELNGTSFTVEMLLWPNEVPSGVRMCPFAINTSSGGNTLLLYMDTADSIRMDVNNSSLATASPIPTTKRSHLLYRYDISTSTHSLFINGILVSEGVRAMTVATNSRISIAQEWDNNVISDRFDGVIDEVAIYPRALTNPEITTRAANALGGSRPRGNSNLRLQLIANRDGDTSWQKHDFTIQRIGWGYNYGNYWGGVI